MNFFYHKDLGNHLLQLCPKIVKHPVYGAPSKARNVNVIYIWTYVWQHWKPSLSICCTMFQHWINAERWVSYISRQSTHECSNVVSSKHRPPLPQEIFPVLISVRGWVVPRALVRPEGLCQWKIPMTPSGIGPATFRFVAQCLNHCTIACPNI